MKCFIVLTFVPLIFALTIPNANNNHGDPGLVDFVRQQQRLFETKTTVAEYKRSDLKINHGTIIPANKERLRATATDSTPSYIHALQTEQAPYHLLARYSNALFALGLLLLVPLTIGIIELAGRLSRCMSVEEFPERGREMHRIKSLQEGEEWALQREKREIKSERSLPRWR
ncbi:hypothetical protein BDW72DRAFT_165481 [Aspergillus terricola var. indicus]